MNSKTKDEQHTDTKYPVRFWCDVYNIRHWCLLHCGYVAWTAIDETRKEQNVNWQVEVHDE